MQDQYASPGVSTAPSTCSDSSGSAHPRKRRKSGRKGQGRKSSRQKASSPKKRRKSGPTQVPWHAEPGPGGEAPSCAEASSPPRPAVRSHVLLVHASRGTVFPETPAVEQACHASFWSNSSIYVEGKVTESASVCLQVEATPELRAALEGARLERGTQVYVPLKLARDDVRSAAMQQGRCLLWGRAKHEMATGENVVERGEPHGHQEYGKWEWWVRREFLVDAQPELPWVPWPVWQFGGSDMAAAGTGEDCAQVRTVGG